MAVGTKIEWTHRPGTIPATMNALVGCQKVSEGCRGCYAIDTAHVRAGNPLPVMQEKFAGTTKREGGKTLWTGKVTLNEKALLAPLKAKKPHTYFVNSMSDLFYDGVPDEWIDRHFAVFALCPQHTFIVLTKRPERMRAYIGSADSEQRLAEASLTMSALTGFIDKPRTHPVFRMGEWTGGTIMDIPRPVGFQEWPLPNVWLGVSVENQKAADERREDTLAVAGLKWLTLLSCEPLLSELDLSRYLRISWQCSGCRQHFAGGYRRTCPQCERECYWTGSHRFNPPGGQTGSALSWVIAGGESGRSARPMHPDWARSLRDQCAAAGVPFFFKQWGEWQDGSEYRGKVENRIVLDDGRSAVNMDGLKLSRGDEHDWSSFRSRVMARVGKKLAGDLLDGQQHHAFPEAQ